MNLNIAQLRAFLAVIDTGGFSAAAARLGLTQPAISHAVASLERALDAPLLVRANPVRPTAIGQRIVPHARLALAAVRSLEQAAARAAAALTGTVRLATTPSVSKGLLPGLLQHWQQVQPGVTVRVFEADSTEIAVWLEQGTADAAVLVDPPPGPGKQLTTDAYRALLPTDHPLASESVIHLRDLADDPLLTSAGGCEQRVHAIHRLVGMPFAPSHRVRDLATLINMVQAGLGAAIVSELARPLIPDDLVLLPLAPHVTRRLVLSGPSARPWHTALDALSASAIDHLESDPACRAGSQRTRQDWPPASKARTRA